ncbi:MAG: IQ calmodulin-binding motif-containing protein [bacterium]
MSLRDCKSSGYATSFSPENSRRAPFSDDRAGYDSDGNSSVDSGLSSPMGSEEEDNVSSPVLGLCRQAQKDMALLQGLYMSVCSKCRQGNFNSESNENKEILRRAEGFIEAFHRLKDSFNGLQGSQKTALVCLYAYYLTYQKWHHDVAKAQSSGQDERVSASVDGSGGSNVNGSELLIDEDGFRSHMQSFISDLRRAGSGDLVEESFFEEDYFEKLLKWWQTDARLHLPPSPLNLEESNTALEEDREVAARVIQARWRQHHARQSSQAHMDRSVIFQQHAATRIQAYVRGWLVRRKGLSKAEALAPAAAVSEDSQLLSRIVASYKKVLDEQAGLTAAQKVRIRAALKGKLVKEFTKEIVRQNGIQGD